ncbi:MAG: amidohydrolase family protein [Thermoanaerobaculales bacterium]
MSIRVILRSPFGDTVTRDIADGYWADPVGDADLVLGEGYWAVPGLVDAHSHLATAELNYQPGVPDEAAERARDALAAGVTLLLDKGWCDETVIDLIAAVPESERPEIEAAAQIIAVEEGYFPDFALEIDGFEIGSVVAEQAAIGAGWVKLVGDWPRRGRGPVANFTEDQLRRAVRVAGESGSRVAIHTMAREVPSLAVAAGIHSIEHGLFLTDSDIADLAERSGMWVPTLLRIEETIAQLGADSGGGRLLLEGLDNARRLLPAAFEAGVRVLAGTDLIGTPANVASEALKLGEYGLSNTQVVETVTTAGFSATGRSPDFAVGASADAVLFPEDPISDLAVLTHPAAVIRKGTVV